MYKEVQIGEKTVGMLANAASPIFYKSLFHEDFLKATQAKEPDNEIVQKMGFIMAMNANHGAKEMMQLTYEQYVDWLISYEPMDLLNAAADIMNVYTGTTLGSAVPKKPGE